MTDFSTYKDTRVTSEELVELLKKYYPKIDAIRVKFLSNIYFDFSITDDFKKIMQQYPESPTAPGKVRTIKKFLDLYDKASWLIVDYFEIDDILAKEK